MKGNSVLSRLWFIYGALFLASIVLSYKLFIVQVIHGEEYSEKAGGQYIRSGSTIFNRGSIYFTKRGGDSVSAATLKSGYILAINPSQLSDPSSVFSIISKLVSIDKDKFFIKASKSGDPYEEIARRVDEDSAVKIKKLSIPGVILSKERWRFYPGGEMAAQTLGFVGYSGDKLSGRYGVERYYDDVLSRGEEALYVNFFAEMFSNINNTFFKKMEREGSIVTSIELSVQGVLENKLGELVDKWGADSAGGVILNPQNGEIYAMSSLPTFNPNTFNTVDTPSVFSNPIVESVFEMGSIIKPLTMAAGIDAGVVTAETTYDDKGFLALDGRRIENYDGKSRGIVSMQEVLNQSLNTGAGFVAQQLGKERFREYMLSFGFGEETGVDLPNEVAGLVNNLNSKRDVEYATASFGQGIAMTPIATARALSALGNGGILITPHVAKSIDYVLGPSRKLSYGEGERVFKKETSEEITRMLVEVMDNALKNGKVKLDNYSVATKTGTAQIARENGRGYYKDRFLHSFFGYFPAYNPKFLVFLYMINPQGVRYASQTLTYPFMDITKFLLNYYDVPPDR